MKALLTLISGLVLFSASAAFALQPSIVVRGYQEATVTGTSVRLDDLAEVTSSRISDDETVIALKKIVLGQSPAAGKEATISAAQILERLKTQGVDVNQIGYSIPRIITVKRASRHLTENEVKAAIEGVLGLKGREASVKSLNFPRELKVSTSDLAIEAMPLSATRPGHIGFNMKVRSAGEPDLTFDADALVDEYQEIPVAGRQLTKGSVIEASDLMKARMNIAKLPLGAALNDELIVGKKTEKELAPGEAFRLDNLSITPVFPAGSRVTMLYRSGALEATATGVALEAGIAGQSVKIRNEASKKVLSGVVTDSGIVEVGK